MNSITSYVVELLLGVTHRFIPDGMKVYALAIIGLMVGVSQLAFGDYSVGGFTLWMSLLALAGRNTAAKLDSNIKAALTSTEKETNPIRAPPTESGIPFYENDGWK